MRQSYQGDSANACLRQGEEFICPSSNASSEFLCDKSKCPLQGPSMAPLLDLQATGLDLGNFRYKIYSQTWDEKFEDELY